ncbi:hypothetical protein AOLI_G00038380 [Acnodon oligacanthus]
MPFNVRAYMSPKATTEPRLTGGVSGDLAASFAWIPHVTVRVQPVDQTPGHYDPVDEEVWDHSAPSARLPERAERIKPSARLRQRHMKFRSGLGSSASGGDGARPPLPDLMGLKTGGVSGERAAPQLPPRARPLRGAPVALLRTAERQRGDDGGI